MTDRYCEIAKTARGAIICADNQGKLTFVNEAAVQVFGYASQELLGADLATLVPERLREAHRRGFGRYVKTGRPKLKDAVVEMVARHKDGSELSIELTMAKTGAGNNFEVFGIVRDISARKELLKQLEKMAKTDYLTSLSNRHSFDKELSIEFGRARRYKKTLSVLMADLDHFKEYNDIYGPQSGDAALRTIAQCFAHETRSSDLVARYGGEELVVVLPETNHIKATAMAERILNSVQNLGLRHEGFSKTGILTVSFGVAGLSEDDTTGFDVVRRADAALYHAKAAGKNRVATEKDIEKPPRETV